MTRKKLLAGMAGALSVLAGLVQWWWQSDEKGIQQRATSDSAHKVIIQKNSGGTSYQIDTTAPVYFTPPTDARSQPNAAPSKPGKPTVSDDNQKQPPKNMAIDQKIFGGEGNVNSVEVH